MAACAVAALARGGAYAALSAAMMVMGAGFGAGPTSAASVAGEVFGRAHYGRNLSKVNLSILLGSFASTVAGSMQTASGSYFSAICLFAGLEVAALLLILLLSRTKSLDY